MENKVKYYLHCIVFHKTLIINSGRIPRDIYLCVPFCVEVQAQQFMEMLCVCRGGGYFGASSLN